VVQVFLLTPATGPNTDYGRDSIERGDSEKAL